MRLRWVIRYGDLDMINQNYSLAGDVLGRRTAGIEPGDSSDAFAIIQNASQDGFDEIVPLGCIFDGNTDGPSVVHVNIASSEASGCDIALSHPAMRTEVFHQARTRVIAVNRGSQLFQVGVKPVRDLLKAMYDGVEALRSLINERNEIRYDFSGYGVLTYAKYAKNNCCALFIEADNSILLKSVDADTAPKFHKKPPFRMGTPRYIARAVSKGSPIDNINCGIMFTTMPELAGKAKEVYVNSYGQNTYDAYTDTVPNTAHGGKLPEERDRAPSFFHRPDHDVESIFWVLVSSVIMAKPLDAPDEPSSTFVEVWEILKDHIIKKSQTFDPRNFLLLMTQNIWLEILHPKLSPIVKMMYLLAKQVCPEYGLLNPPPKPDHLHEAFRRIILEQILSMGEDPIPLMPNVTRSIPVQDGSEDEDNDSTLDSEAEPSAHPSKKRKTGDDGNFERRSKLGRYTKGISSSTLFKE